MIQTFNNDNDSEVIIFSPDEPTLSAPCEAAPHHGGPAVLTHRAPGQDDLMLMTWSVDIVNL